MDSLLGDVRRVVAELFEAERHAEDTPQLARARAQRGLICDALETFLLDEPEEVVDLLVLRCHLLREAGVSLKKRGHRVDELRLVEPRHHGKILAGALDKDPIHGPLSDPRVSLSRKRREIA